MPADPLAAPELTTVRVADDGDVEPLLNRAAAELAALTLRLGAVTRRADAAEALAAATGSPDGMTLDEEAAELGRRLEEEQAEHRHQLDVELAEARAAAAAMVEAARTDAIELVRLATTELDIAVATFGGSPAPVATPPVESSVRIDLEPATPELEPLLPDEPGPEPDRGLRLDLVLKVLAIAIVLIVLFAWAR